MIYQVILKQIDFISVWNSAFVPGALCTGYFLDHDVVDRDNNDQHVKGAYQEPGMHQNAFHKLTHLILTTTL